MRVAQRTDRDSRRQIEIAFRIDIPNVTPFATFQDEIEPRIRRNDISLKQFANALCFVPHNRWRRSWQNFLHNTTSVPTPASVKISSKTECGVRPSTN